MVVMIDEKTQLDKGFKFYANIVLFMANRAAGKLDGSK